jgi:L-alanine-DL-glutamate epimerase-like enolase superfamily enzyme
MNIQPTGTSSAAQSSIPEARITSVHAAPLFGESPKGGWSAEIKPEDSIHAIIAVHTDIGVTGYGSVFTDGRLVEAGIKVLEPLFAGENALEPERVCEKLHQNTFWMGRGGTLTHTISGIDIALWDILGKVTGMPVGRLLGGTYRKRVQPYCSLLMDQPGPMHDLIAEYRDRGFRAFKIGWGPFGRATTPASTRRSCARRARRRENPRSSSSMQARAMRIGPTGSNGPCAPPRC